MNYSEPMFYIVNEDINAHGNIGVKKKIYAQTRVFKKHFSRCLITCYAYGMAYLLEGEQVIEKEVALSREACFTCYCNWMKKYHCHKAYMRCIIPASCLYLSFLQEMKEMGVCVVLEYPTYPYEGEVKNEEILQEDREYRGQIGKYVSFATTYAKGQTVHGIHTAALQNGINVEEHVVRNVRKKDMQINLLAVAGFSSYLGFERVLEGLYLYYRNPKRYDFHFYMVGEGYEKRNYIHLVKEYGLDQHVEFCGIKTGKALDWYYDNADIGIAPMGMYKVGIDSATPIKTREYCSRGMPFVYGYNDDGFTGQESYVHKISNSPKPLDMKEVISLYERTVEKKNIIDEMRSYAEEKFSWDVLLKEVVEYMKYD